MISASFHCTIYLLFVFFTKLIIHESSKPGNHYGRPVLLLLELNATASRGLYPVAREYTVVLKTVFVQQEVIDAHNQDSILIVMRCRSVLGDDNTLEEIPGQHQRTLLLLHLGLIRNRVSRLDIITLGTFIEDKVDFQLFTDAVALLIGVILYDDAHIHIEAADFQLIQNDVFHDVGFFQVPEIQTGISQPMSVK